jgi:hypothetical protein
VNRRDRDAWKSARTITDLGRLTARWLEGDLGDQPGCLDGPSAETLPLIPVLAVLNRAGYVTTASQPGIALDGDGWEQRAAVEFLAIWPWQVPVMKHATDAGLIVVAHDPASLPRWRNRYRRVVPVTRCQGRVTTSFGAQRSRRSIRDRHTGFGECHPEAVREALGAWQVTVIDPQWGPSGRLWRSLAGVVLSPRGSW